VAPSTVGPRRFVPLPCTQLPVLTLPPVRTPSTPPPSPPPLSSSTPTLTQLPPPLSQRPPLPTPSPSPPSGGVGDLCLPATSRTTPPAPCTPPAPDKRSGGGTAPVGRTQRAALEARTWAPPPPAAVVDASSSPPRVPSVAGASAAATPTPTKPPRGWAGAPWGWRGAAAASSPVTASSAAASGVVGERWRRRRLPEPPLLLMPPLAIDSARPLRSLGPAPAAAEPPTVPAGTVPDGVPPARRRWPVASTTTSTRGTPRDGGVVKARTRCSRGCGATFGNRSGRLPCAQWGGGGELSAHFLMAARVAPPPRGRRCVGGETARGEAGSPPRLVLDYLGCCRGHSSTEPSAVPQRRPGELHGWPPRGRPPLAGWVLSTVSAPTRLPPLFVPPPRATVSDVPLTARKHSRFHCASSVVSGADPSRLARHRSLGGHHTVPPWCVTDCRCVAEFCCRRIVRDA